MWTAIIVESSGTPFCTINNFRQKLDIVDVRGNISVCNNIDVRWEYNSCLSKYLSVPLSAEAIGNVTGRCIARIQTYICVRKLVIYTKMRLSHSDNTCS